MLHASLYFFTQVIITSIVSFSSSFRIPVGSLCLSWIHTKFSIFFLFMLLQHKLFTTKVLGVSYTEIIADFTRDMNETVYIAHTTVKKKSPLKFIFFLKYNIASIIKFPTFLSMPFLHQQVLLTYFSVTCHFIMQNSVVLP